MIWLAGLALALLALGAPSKSPKGGGIVKGPKIPATLSSPAIWSLGSDWASRCNGRVPVIPAASSGWGKEVRKGLQAPLVWGWTGPGQREAVQLYEGRFVADVETYVTAKGATHWTGAASEIGHAEWLAARCPAVTSHGMIAPVIREQLRVFGRAGVVGVPQVYDSDRSTVKDPRGFLRRCVDSYVDRGQFERVTPLLGLSAGLDIVEAWIDECEKMGIPYHLWSLQRLLEGGGAACEVVR